MANTSKGERVRSLKGSLIPPAKTTGGKDRGRSGSFKLVVSLLLGLLLAAEDLYGHAYPYKMPPPGCPCPCPSARMVIGVIREYQVQKKDTLLDIARKFDLGYNELQILYPDLDPWLPPEGMILKIPTKWVLPEFHQEGIVVNVPEMRLYLFMPRHGLVKTHPIGIGIEEYPTPLGSFRVKEKKVDPVWYVPPSLKDQYKGITAVPPGPDNPLGRYWIGLTASSYGIHGTNKPWGVGRLVSRGCIRMYPEDIETLFPLVTIGMRVDIVYQPVKFGCDAEKIYIEVHPDLYGRIGDLFSYALSLARSKGISEKISLPLLYKAVKERKGIPELLTP